MSSYADAGVDIDAGDRAVELMKAHVARARRPEVVDDASGFAGLFDASALAGMKRPLLVSSTDGVGTKVELARRLERYDTVGIDLVAMVVDDLAVTGAEPLFMTDYIACGKVVPARIASIVAGVAEGCRIAGCALIGGETAEHPGLLEPDEFDLAGAATGVVEADDLLGPHRVTAGDVVLGMASSGLHSNGFSLVRHVLGDSGLDELGPDLLTPTRIYAQDCLELARAGGVRAFAHITGGGLAANLARSLPANTSAILARASWTPQPIFGTLQARGDIPAQDMERTFNMGVGMCAIVAAETAPTALAVLAGRDLPSWILGEVIPGNKTVILQ